MADPFSAFAAATTVVSAISSLFGSDKAARAAKAAAEEEARREREATTYKIGELRREHAAQVSSLKYGYSVSGVRPDTGSPLSVLREMQATNRRERFYTGRAGASKISAIKASGAAQASAYRASGFQSAIQQLGQSALLFKQAFDK